MDETIGYHHLLFIRVTFWYLGVFVYGRGGELRASKSEKR
jgi:hypothetical protein